MKTILKKYFFSKEKLLKKIINKKFSQISDLKNLKQSAISKNWFLNKDLFVFWTKNDFILPVMLNSYILVYNGHTFILIYIKEHMLGRRIGEFVITKKLGNLIHNDKKKKNPLKN